VHCGQIFLKNIGTSDYYDYEHGPIGDTVMGDIR
jgi:hypothetical protein